MLFLWCLRLSSTDKCLLTYLQTNKQTNREPNAGHYITSLADVGLINIATQLLARDHEPGRPRVYPCLLVMHYFLKFHTVKASFSVVDEYVLMALVWWCIVPCERVGLTIAVVSRTKDIRWTVAGMVRRSLQVINSKLSYYIDYFSGGSRIVLGRGFVFFLQKIWWPF